MEDDLRERFIQQKIDDLINDNVKPLPTLIFEIENPEILRLIQKFVLYSKCMKSLTIYDIEPMIYECLEENPIIDYGNLYILVNPN